MARDARFDGRFFIGVRTTGVYCRPICRARTPKPSNVVVFPTAAAAAAAGFRPCLRCHPETAPGAPAWRGTLNTVTRAMRLIAGGALTEASMAGLAARVGIGPRHLTRLFAEHVGASPSLVERTRRVHFAKRLVDETDLALTDVAFAAGFGSVRRFNEAFLDTFGRPPSAFRRIDLLERHTGDARALRISLTYREPLAWPLLVDYMARRATPGVETVQGQRYARVISFGGQPGWFSVQPGTKSRSLELAMALPDPRALPPMVERVRRLFDLDCDPLGIAADLERDVALRPLLRARAGLRVPGAWDGFELAVRAILGQQVTVAGATALAGRLAETYGEPMSEVPIEGLRVTFPTPQVLAAAPLSSIGLPARRAETIRQLARAVCSGEVAFGDALDTAALVARLRRVPGIGPWTADYIAMRAGNDPDAFPSTDLGLLRASARLGLGSTPAALAARSEVWRPWRAYAAMVLWHS